MLALKLPEPKPALAAAAFKTFLPQSWLGLVTGSLWASVPALMLLAVLISICSEADAFVAASLAMFPRPALLAFLAWMAPSMWPYLQAAPVASATANNAVVGDLWQPWSPEAQAQLLAQGRPVFVDYTAAWCVTCQYNKKTTLANEAVLRALDDARVQTFRADWTRRDPQITAELQKLGRAGVPVYVLQAPGKAPIVLSEVISAGDVQDALARLAPG